MAGHLYSTGALYEHCVTVTTAKCCHMCAVTVLHCNKAVQGGTYL